MKRMLITDETKYFLRKLGLFHKKKYKIFWVQKTTVNKLFKYSPISLEKFI